MEIEVSVTIVHEPIIIAVWWFDKELSSCQRLNSYKRGQTGDSDSKEVAGIKDIGIEGIVSDNVVSLDTEECCWLFLKSLVLS